MEDSKEIREFKKTLNYYSIKPMYAGYFRHCDLDYMIELRDKYLLNNDWFSKRQIIIINKILEIYKTGEKLGLTLKDIKSMCFRLDVERHQRNCIYSKRPQKETRDNKGVYVGSGGSNRHKVRYPKKNRSKRVWATFYKMFPYYAERDNWNGETSDRMK